MERAKQMEYWLSGLFCFMQNLAILLLLDAFFERKVHKAKFLGGFFLWVLITVIFVNVVHVPISALKMLGCVAIDLVLSRCLYKGQFGMRLLVVLLGYAICYLVEFLVDICVPIALSIDYETFVYDRVLFVVATVGDSLFLIFISLLIRQFHRPRRHMKPAEAWVVLLIPLATLVLLFPLYLLLLYICPMKYGSQPWAWDISLPKLLE